MRRIFTVYTLVVILLFFGGQFIVGDAPQDLESQLTSYMGKKVQENQFSGVVLITKNKKVLLSKAYGWANAEHRVANTTKTKFRIGSVSKQFTAMAIMMLRERGKLKVEDSIKIHLVDIPEAWSKITIHQMLSHTSGLPDMMVVPDWKQKVARSASLESTINWFRDKPLLFPPGKSKSYSSVSYALLNRIIERISGQKMETFLQKKIFKPLGMKDSGTDQRTRIIPHLASGYFHKGNHSWPAPSYYFAGGADLYSTVGDMVLWGNAISEGRLISRESYKKMFSPVKVNNGAKFPPFLKDYAYGMGIRKISGRTVLAHGGWLPGHNTYVVFLPEEKFNVIVMSNATLNRSTIPNLSARMGKELAAIVLGE